MREHWVMSIQDSLNDYYEVRFDRFDGTKAQASKFFLREYGEYVGDPRYQIIMRANPVVLQWPGEKTDAG